MTPDTEWEKVAVDETETLIVGMINAYCLKTFGKEMPDVFRYGELVIPDLVKESLHSLLASRDTYWKERVRKEVEGMKRVPAIGRNDGKIIDYTTEQDKAHNQALDTLLDNLK